MSDSTAVPAVSTDAATSNPAGPAEPAVPADAPTPPWGDEAEFDAEKAWNLIQNLRAESKDAKEKVRGFEDAQLSAQQKAERDNKELAESLATAQTQNARLQALVDNPGLQAEDLDLIAGSTVEEIKRMLRSSRPGWGQVHQPLHPLPSAQMWLCVAGLTP